MERVRMSLHHSHWEKVPPILTQERQFIDCVCLVWVWVCLGCSDGCCACDVEDMRERAALWGGRARGVGGERLLYWRAINPSFRVNSLALALALARSLPLALSRSLPPSLPPFLSALSV